MVNRYVPPSIDSYGGITPFLKATKAKHRGNDATTLIKYWNWGEGKHLNITNLAIMFDVGWTTMDSWLDRLHTEYGKPRPGKVANTSALTDNKE
jgi:hypothetical protein